MNVKIVGSWKIDEKEKCYLIIWKIIKLILEARKSSEKQKLVKEKKIGEKKRKKKKKQAEKANSSLNQKQEQKANSPLNQKTMVKRIQGFEH